MTRERLTALDVLLSAATMDTPEVLAAIKDVSALAREALELREALEWASDRECVLGRDLDGSYTCAEGGGHKCFGTTPLEAIQESMRLARRSPTTFGGGEGKQ